MFDRGRSIARLAPAGTSYVPVMHAPWLSVGAHERRRAHSSGPLPSLSAIDGCVRNGRRVRQRSHSRRQHQNTVDGMQCARALSKKAQRLQACLLCSSAASIDTDCLLFVPAHAHRVIPYETCSKPAVQSLRPHYYCTCYPSASSNQAAFAHCYRSCALVRLRAAAPHNARKFMFGDVHYDSIPSASGSAQGELEPSTGRSQSTQRRREGSHGNEAVEQPLQVLCLGLPVLFCLLTGQYPTN